MTVIPTCGKPGAKRWFQRTQQFKILIFKYLLYVEKIMSYPSNFNGIIVWHKTNFKLIESQVISIKMFKAIVYCSYKYNWKWF
jgi:hypothetical protein